MKNLLILFTLFVTAIGYSQTFTENFITYSVIPSTSTVLITDYDTAGGTVVNIPVTVTNTTSSITYTVTAIGANAFIQNQLTSVTILNNVTNIGTAAFAQNELISIAIPNSITSIDVAVFSDNQLTSVTIPSSVTSIGEQAFTQNELISITIPNSVTSIGDSAFNENQLTSVTIPNSVTSIGNRAFHNNQLTSVTIPNSITTLADFIFANNSITSVTIPSNITNIGVRAFYSNQLTTITIPSSVTNIGIEAFRFNPLTSVVSEATTPPTIATSTTLFLDSFGDRSGIDLTIPLGTSGPYVTDAGALWTGFNTVTEVATVGDTFIVDFITYEITSIAASTVEAIDYDMVGGAIVNIPEIVTFNTIAYGVISIGEDAFKENQLTSIVIPDSVTSLGINAFASNNLVSVVIPNTVTNVADGAFQINQLTSVTISESITSINAFVFSDNQLTTVIIPSNITSIGTGAFQYNALTAITIPDNVITIFNIAFLGNQLTTVTIPANVLNIGNEAFMENPLTTVTSVSITPPTITTGGANDSFSENRGSIDLIIPVGTTGVYVTDAGALWTDFKSVTEDGTLSNAIIEFDNEVVVISSSELLKVISPSNIQLQNYILYSISGAKIATGTETEITTSFLASGVYILKLDFDKGTVVKRVLVY